MIKENMNGGEPMNSSLFEEDAIIPRIAIIVSKFYPNIAEMLVKGAEKALKNKKLLRQILGDVEYEIIEVPGALEIPAAIANLMRVRDPLSGLSVFHGYVALGCVIRGETSHYDIVAEQSAAGLMKLSLEEGLAIGNGILTVENEAQALVRADPKQGNKGLHAVEACLNILGMQMQYEISPLDMSDSLDMDDLEDKLNMISEIMGLNDETDEEEDEDGFSGQEPN